jgi:hypothetical protein
MKTGPVNPTGKPSHTPPPKTLSRPQINTIDLINDGVAKKADAFQPVQLPITGVRVGTSLAGNDRSIEKTKSKKAHHAGKLANHIIEKFGEKLGKFLKK